MLAQSILFLLSVLCTAVRAAPTSSLAKRSTASRGLLYAPGPGLSAFSGEISWSTNWATASSAGDVDLGSYVSQYWGTDSVHAGNFEADSGNYQGAALIGYNEPDIISEAWISPAQALTGWEVINQYNKIASIGTPAVSNSALSPQSGTSAPTDNGIIPSNTLTDNPQGIEWMSSFLDLASGQYTFDFLNFHWYGGKENPIEADQAMIQQQVTNMTNLAAAHGITDVWITEMKVLNSATECEFIQWFESTFLPNNTAITHYAYNQELGSLNDGSGLSTAGQVYLGEGSC